MEDKNKEGIQWRNPFDYYIHECHRRAEKKGFWDKKRNKGEAIALVITELCEALEAHRNNKKGMFQKDTFEDELADTFIRLFDLCGDWAPKIEQQIVWKMNYNKNRPYKHGKEY